MRNLFIVPIILLLISCAGPKPKPESFDNAEQAIEAAVAAGAEQHSPVELRFAREKLAEARKGVELKQYDKTLYLIEQSEINAELALEKSRAAVVRGEVTELARQNEILREEFERNYGEKFE
jgi:Asp-tRNA(Asn)/Glu-tRNA(Gln) amidotransferase A subunit family amidase